MRAQMANRVRKQCGGAPIFRGGCLVAGLRPRLHNLWGTVAKRGERVTEAERGKRINRGREQENRGQVGPTYQWTGPSRVPLSAKLAANIEFE